MAAAAAAGPRSAAARPAAADALAIAAQADGDARDRAHSAEDALDPRADDPRGDGAGLLLPDLRVLPEPQVFPAVHHHGRHQVRPDAPSGRPGPDVRARAGPAAAPTARHRLHGVLPVLRLPVVPAAGAARPDRVVDLVEEHHLRLLVRHLAGHRLVARHAVLLRAPDARPRHCLPLHLHRSATDSDDPADGGVVGHPPRSSPRRHRGGRCSRSPASPACTSRSPCWWR